MLTDTQRRAGRFADGSVKQTTARAPESNWPRREAIAVPDRGRIAQILARVGEWDGESAVLSGGLRSTNLAVTVDGRQLVLRISANGTAEAVPAKEAAVMRMVRPRVCAPSVIASGREWVLIERVGGRRMDEVLVDCSVDEALSLARSAGEVCREIARHRFDCPGFLSGSGPVVATKMPPSAEVWRSLLAGLIEPSSGRLGERVGRLRQWLTEVEPALAEEGAVLCHGDFKPTNLFVLDGEVTAVLDWEFAWSGPSSFDVGQFLRWERMYPPRFSAAFAQGRFGQGAPLGWRLRAAAWDLVNLLHFVADPASAPSVVGDCLVAIDHTMELRREPG